MRTMSLQNETFRDKGYVFGLVSFLLLAGVVSCGGGGGGGDDGGGGNVVPPVAVRSVGTITALGSITVNGIKFEVTDTSQLIIEDETGPTQSELKLGRVVSIEGELATDDSLVGNATRIRFEDNLEGPIGSVDIGASGLVKTIVVMGQTVVIEDGLTMFDNNDPAFDTFAELDASDVGMVVEVSGLPRPDGKIQASFIQKKAVSVAALLAAGDDLEIKGEVSNLNVTGTAFNIGLLNISLTPALVRNGPLANGSLVEVKGSAFDAGTNTLTATDVEVKVEGLGGDIAKVEVEGFLSGLDTSNRRFTVEGQLVSYASARFDGGAEIDLSDGIKIEAEGPIVGGVLNARKVVFKHSIRLEANVATANPLTGSITLDGLPGVTVVADGNMTEFRGLLGGVSGLATGNNIRIRGRLSGSTIMVSRLELQSVNPDSRVIFQGPVSSLDAGAGTLVILGITVNTGSITEPNFKDHDTVIGKTAFFAALKANTLVKARADLAGGVLTWNQIELED